MGEYHDSWAEFRDILDATKTKLLKKPKYDNMKAVAEFRQLSQRMTDEECPENAALCHVEIAHIHEKTGNWNQQRKNLLKAAVLFQECQKKRSLMQYTVYSDLKNMITDCYFRAVDLTMREGFLISAGVYSVELGSAVMEMGDFANAYEHLTRGYRLLQSDYYCMLNVTSKLMYCAYTLAKYEEVLVMLDHLWADSMKRQPLSTLGKKVLLEAEINTILVLMKSKRSADGRHKLLLISLDNDFTDAVDSVLSEYEFTIIKAFTEACRQNDIVRARRIYSFSLKKLMDDTGCKVALDIMDSIPAVFASDHLVSRGEENAKDLKRKRQKTVARIREHLAL
ncbi:hypothetical protein QR680_017559 [Steinernema hermaphroditum]|uniref:Uncharacterized protein n=1 Tax=Steinernema hermaphroditum TaxID=289476 RepID=A0AA39LP90_9BILA|nr:hypothetical protein QR680_017559 [Steinernema hermaphroditum]